MLEEFDSLHPDDGQKTIPVSRMYFQNPPTNIGELSLETELLNHYMGVRAFLADVAGSDKCPPNQVAQVTNSLTAVLDKIIKLRESVINMERMNKIEQALVDCLKRAPTDIQDAFFADYEKILKQYEK